MSPEQLKCYLSKDISLKDICEIENRKTGELVQRAYKAGRKDMREQIYPEDPDRRAAWFGDVR